MAYVGKKPCGCVTFAAVISERSRDLAAKESAKAIRRGETVERVTVEAVRSMEFRCADHRTPQPRPKRPHPQQMAMAVSA